ncbi:response regulator [Candidatus Bathyarchaeota archaeon]|nr:response regulator [Candidatus Bathyarchaeota archaeon]
MPINILLAEDDTAHAEIVRRKLEDFPVANRLFLAKDGQEALDFLFRKGACADPETSPRPDLILLDVRLPRVDGLGVLRRIKNDGNLKRIPTVMITTSDDNSDIDAAYVQGAGSYLMKPMNFGKFDKMMDALCSYWLTWNIFSVHDGR